MLDGCIKRPAFREMDGLWLSINREVLATAVLSVGLFVVLVSLVVSFTRATK